MTALKERVKYKPNETQIFTQLLPFTKGNRWTENWQKKSQNNHCNLCWSFRLEERSPISDIASRIHNCQTAPSPLLQPLLSWKVTYKWLCKIKELTTTGCIFVTRRDIILSSINLFSIKQPPTRSKCHLCTYLKILVNIFSLFQKYPCLVHTLEY